jgi:hypothetical protein
MALSADGRTGGRRSRPSLRSLRNTDVLRNSTPPGLTQETESLARRVSEGHLNNLNKDRSQSPQDALSKSERIGKSIRTKRSTSIKFRRVDVDWTPGQLEDQGADGVLVDTGHGSNEEMDNSVVESLQMEIMDLRPSTHPGIIDASFVSLLDDEVAREMFRVQLGVTDADLHEDMPASHWEMANEAALHQSIMHSAATRRASWNSSNSISPHMDDDFNSVSGSIISNMSMSQSAYSRTVNSNSSSKDSSNPRSEPSWMKNLYYKKYVKPMVLIVGLAALTASLIYIFMEGIFEEEFESWTYESRSVVRNWLGEGDEEGAAEGGRVLEESEIVGSLDGIPVPVRMGSTEGGRRLHRTEGKDKSAEKARRTSAKEKNALLANGGIGNI